MMDSPSVNQDHSLANSENDAIARLQDLIPELDSSYDIVRSIGQGTFSRVYLAKLKTPAKNSSQSFQLALKHIIPTSHPSRVHMELQCLHKLGGCNNVIGVWGCHRHLNHIALAMPYIPHDSTSDYMGCLSISEVRDYLANLLAAVQHVHRHDILHRDIKPANFLYHRATNRYCLVDFGLAQEMNSRNTPSSKHRIPSAVPPRPPTPLPPTPHLYTNRPVKRKLPVDMALSECCGSSNKRAKVSPTQPPHNVLTAAASRLNASHPHLAAGVRRSPRKCSLRSPSKKENFGAPTGGAFETSSEAPLKQLANMTQKTTVETSQKKPIVSKMKFSPSEKSLNNCIAGVSPDTASCVTPQKSKGPLVRGSPDANNTTPRKAAYRAAAGVTPQKRTSCTTAGAVVTPVPVNTFSSHLELLGPPAPGTVTPRKGASRAAVQAQWPQDSPSKHTRLAEAARRRDQPQPSSSESGSGSSLRVTGPPPKLKSARLRKASSLDRADSKRSPSNDLSQGGHQPLVDTTTTTPAASVSSRLVSLTKASDAFTSNTTGCWELSKRTSCSNEAKAASDSKSGLSGNADKSGCRCYGRGQLCKKCQGRPQQVAARAGTPGFRPPEVLLRYPRQGAGVDMWACGVVGMCLASGRHPFFRAPDDQTALAELCTLFSTKAIRKAAAALDKLFVSNVDRPPLDLMKVCETLRLSCVPDAAPLSDGSCVTARLQQPCQRCLQPRVCVCKEDAATAAMGIMRSDDTKPNLDFGNDGPNVSAGTNSPTLDYLNILAKKSVAVKGEVFRSPLRSARVCAIANSPLKVKKENITSHANDGNSCGGDGPEDSNDKCTSSTNKQSYPKDSTSSVYAAAHTTPTRPLPSPLGSPSYATKGEGERASPNRRRRPPLYAAPYPKSFYNLVGSLLDLNPATRISAEKALQHPFLKGARINSYNR